MENVAFDGHTVKSLLFRTNILHRNISIFTVGEPEGTFLLLTFTFQGITKSLNISLRWLQ